MGTAESALRFNLFAKDQTGPGIRSADSNFSKFGKGLVTKFAAAAGAVAAVSMFKGFIDDARESAKVGRLTEAVIKSTGGAAKVTADQVGDLATAISNKTGADDEAIQSGANLLLTFTNIKNGVGKNNDIFNQATQTITDMTAALNNGDVSAQGIKASSIQLGKALNDPIKGVGALSKVGVSFTEAQKKQIKTMVDTGDTMGAQKVILGELKREFGGAAAAASDPAQKASVAWGNLKEQIGTGLLPVFNQVATFASTTLIPAISNGVTKLGPMFKSVSKAVSVFWWAFKGESSPGEFDGKLNKINRAGIAVGAWIRNDFLPAARQFGAWIRDVGIPAVQKLGAWLATNLWPAVKQLARSFRQDLLPAIQGLIGKFKEAWPSIQRFLTIVGQVAGFILTKVVPVLIQFYAKYLAAVIRVFGNVFVAGWKVVNFLIDLGAAVGHAGAAFGRFVGRVAGAMKDAYNAVRKGIDNAVGFIKGLPGKAVDAIGDLGSLLKDAGKKLLQGFIDGIKDKFNDVKNTLGDLTGKLTSWKGPPPKDRALLRPAGQSIIGGLITGMTDQIPRVKSTLRALTDKIAIGITDGKPDVDSAASSLVDSLMAKVQEAKDFGKNIRDSLRGLGDLSGIDTMVTDAAGNERQGGLPALLAGLKKQVADAAAFAAAMKRLRKAGLNADSLAGLRDAGPSGGLAAASQLLSGGASAIGEVNQLQASLNQTAKVFADRETKAMYGFSGNPNAALLKQGGQTIRLELDLRGGSNDALVKMLREAIRAKGGNVQLVLGKS